MGTKNLIDFISAKPTVMHGQPCITGTRIPASVVLDCFADGMTEAEILEGYPTLTVEGIRAAAAFGAMLARDEFLPFYRRADAD